MKTGDIKYMEIEEFIDEGYLQEVNRRFLHPLGLALEASLPDGTLKVWDYRDDPEGIAFKNIDSDVMLRKARHVWSLWKGRQKPREDSLGYMIQPIFMVKEEE